MADGHLPGTQAAIQDWLLDGDSAVLDVGCGNGWALRLLIERGAGWGMGVDVSAEMVSRARAFAAGDARQRFEVAEASSLPLEDGVLTHILSVESLYYQPDPAASLAEWARVAAPGARLGLMIDLYLENPGSHAWVSALDVDVHLLSTAGLVAMARAAGWRQVQARQVVDPRPLTAPDAHKASPFWPSYADYLRYREAGSLVVVATR